MKKISLLLSVLLLSACATRSSPQVSAYREYMDANRPRAEQGLMPWSEYYEGMYSKALAAGAPAGHLNRIIGMIDAAKKYEKGQITKDDFTRARRIAQAGEAADRQAEEERENQRNVAAAAAFVGAMNAANQATAPTYKIVQPAQLQATQQQPIAPLSTAARANWTGRQEPVQTITYKSGWNCEYNYAGRTFWRVFVGSCPSSIEVQ